VNNVDVKKYLKLYRVQYFTKQFNINQRLSLDRSLATKSQKIATPVICPFLPDQVGLKYGKSGHTPLEFV
jgi:hypothetical protein